MGNQTPETIRAAAYLATRERLDARKTTRNVQCNPPNIRCGNRCIPPTWDCRLKGQGTDPHLRAVKTDPLGGLANIQRGFGRISKGIIKGNFSEVEGGKAAIIRGTVKIAPGNIQQKNELKKKLEDRTAAIGIGLAVVTGGLGIHALLMKSNTFGYRDGVGADINRSVRLGVSKILDATPVIGANRARVRAQVASGISAQLSRQSNPVSAELTNQLSRTKPSAADEDSRSSLVKRLTEIDEDIQYRGANSTFNEWDRAHQAAFWSTTKVDKSYGESSIFARPATDEFLARQFNLQGDDTLTSAAVKDAVGRNITAYKNDLIDLAQQQGFKVEKTSAGGRTIAKNDRRAFIQGVVSSALPRGTANERVRSALTTHLEQTLTKAPTTRANEIYKETFNGFNDYYTTKATVIENATAQPRLTKQMRDTGAGQTLLDARQARASFVSGREIKGPSHAELALRQYHAQNVARTPRSMFTVTDRLARAAASEIEGRSVGSAEAFRVLEREGIAGAVPQRSQAARAPRPLTEGEAVYNLMRENPGMTLQAARREVKRRRGDSDDFFPELVRTATYLAARADFQEGERLGKPCGASHIPKAHECRKGQGAPTKASTPESGKKIRNRAAIAAAVGVGTALTAGGALAYKNREIVVPEISKRVIKNLSRSEVDAGINRMPKQFQKSVRELVGDAKTSAAYMALKSKGGEVVSVNTKDNFTNWKMKDGTLLSTGSVGETLLIYSTKPQRSIGGAQTYSTQFRVDGEFDAKSASASRNARGVASTVKKMFQAQVDQLPNNSIIYAIPYSNDDKGNKRRSIYEKYGFRSVLSSDERLFAMKRGGSFTRMQDSHIEQIADLIRNDRADAAGKPCGASHIPKEHACTKGQGAAVTPSPSTDIKRKAALAAAVVGGALAIGTAGSVAYNLKTLSDPTKSPLDPSPNIKDLVKSMKQETGTKSASEAMGHYYTKKSGLKPGDVVYFRHEKDPAAHFGIYLGEGKDGIVRAVIANTHKSRFSWTDVAEIGATKSGIKTSQALMPPLIKAPAPKFKQSAGSFSNDEVVRRAIRIANTDYKFSLTRDNCEALANGIAYGVPESEQLQRFRRATRAVVDVGVSRGQRREAREAIYQGRAQGRSYTAREFVTFLEGQREFSSPAGKELAKQYAQYFQNSRLDAAAAPNGLISPDELWSRIKSYGPAVKAQAMADYFLIQRSLLELNGPT